MRKLIPLLLLALPVWAAPSISQSATYSSGLSVGSSAITFTLGSAPTVGNILICFCSYSDNGVTRIVTPASGTWTQVDNLGNASVAMVVYWHLVTAGDTANWTFNISGAADFCSGVLYEVTGENPSAPIDKHTIVGTAGTSITTTAATPSVLNDLPLSAVTTDDGVSQGQSVTGVSANWTLDKSVIPQYHPTFTAFRTITTDTTTAISNTFTMGYVFTGQGVTSLVLIAPAATGATAGSFTSIF